MRTLAFCFGTPAHGSVASRRGEIVLDGFAGSGTTVIAAEKSGRRARAIELEPRYVDVAIRRWQTLTGGSARHAQSGRTFSELEAERSLAPGNLAEGGAS